MSHIHLWMHIIIFQKTNWKKLPMLGFMYNHSLRGLQSRGLAFVATLRADCPESFEQLDDYGVLTISELIAKNR